MRQNPLILIEALKWLVNVYRNTTLMVSAVSCRLRTWYFDFRKASPGSRPLYPLFRSKLVLHVTQVSTACQNHQSASALDHFVIIRCQNNFSEDTIKFVSQNKTLCILGGQNCCYRSSVTAVSQTKVHHKSTTIIVRHWVMVLIIGEVISQNQSTPIEVFLARSSKLLLHVTWVFRS